MESREDAENEAGQEGCPESDEDDHRGKIGFEGGNERKKNGENVTEDDAKEAAARGKKEGFDEEFAENVAVRCAD